MIAVEAGLLERVAASSGEFGLEFVSDDSNRSAAMASAARAVSAIRHPEEPDEDFGFVSRVFDTPTSSWFRITFSDLVAYPDVAHALLDRVVAALNHISDGELRWTDALPPPPEPRLPHEYPLRLPEELPLPDGAFFLESNLHHHGGTRWSFARIDFDIHEPLEVMRSRYRAALESAGWVIEEAARGWRVTRGAVVAEVMTGQAAESSRVRIQFEAADNTTWLPFEPPGD